MTVEAVLTTSPFPHTAVQVRPLGEPLVAASVELYRCVVRDMLPTPSKSHYLFNTRDLGKLVMGIMQVRTRGGLACARTAGIPSSLYASECMDGGLSAQTACVADVHTHLTFQYSPGQQGVHRQQGRAAAALVPRGGAHARRQDVGRRRQGVAAAPDGRAAGGVLWDQHGDAV